MKTHVLFITRIVATFALIICNSCSKNTDSSHPDSVRSIHVSPLPSLTPSSHTRTVYSCSPGVGVYPPTNPSCPILNGVYMGGIIRAKITALSGNQCTLSISKYSGVAFPVGAIAKLKMGSVSNTTLATKTLSSVSSIITVTVNLGFNQGFLSIIPVVEASGAKYYAEPISIYTTPMYNTTPAYDGLLFGTVNGVDVRASGLGNIDTSAPWSTWQCTEFCHRYYSQVYGVNFSYGNAGTWWSHASSMGLVFLPATGSIKPIPQVGDILEFTHAGGYGHVMIVIEVRPSQIKVAHQNGGLYTWPIGGTFSLNSSQAITNMWSGYSYAGLLRKP